MTSTNYLFKAQDEKHKEAFSQGISLRQYLADRKINWGKRQIEALELPVLLAYQLNSSQTFFVSSGKSSCYVYPRHFLDSYISKITRGDTVIKKLEKYFPFGTGDFYAFRDGLRVTLNKSEIGSDFSSGYDEPTIARIGGKIEQLLMALCLPVFEFVYLDRASGRMNTVPEYPRYFLTGIDERFYEEDSEE